MHSFGINFLHRLEAVPALLPTSIVNKSHIKTMAIATFVFSGIAFVAYEGKLAITFTVLGALIGVTLVINALAVSLLIGIAAGCAIIAYRYISKCSIEKPKPNSPIHISILPKDVMKVITTFLKLSDLRAFSLVDRQWKQIASDPLLWKRAIYREIAFGQKHWEESPIGKRKLTPAEIEADFNSLPSDIWEILKSPCPVFPNTQVGKSHILVKMPETINEKPVTRKLLEDFLRSDMVIVESRLRPHKTNYPYPYYGHSIADDKGFDKPIEKSYWILMTKDILPNSKDKEKHDEYEAMVASLAEKANISYVVPKPSEALACISAEFLRSQTCLFGSMTYTLCKENFRSTQFEHHTNLLFSEVGDFQRSLGIDVSYKIYRSQYRGVAALQRFLEKSENTSMTSSTSSI